MQARAPTTGSRKRVAVVGGGVAGLSAAGELLAGGADVTVFDKGRRPAGRISTRHAGRFDFDHGAQYFTARDPVFRELVEALSREGVVAPWRARVVTLDPRAGTPSPSSERDERWVGVPGMSALAGRLARDLDVRSATRIVALGRRAGRWSLTDEGGARHGDFDALVLALPAAQTAVWLEPGTSLRTRVEAVDMAPCLAVMLGLARPWEVGFDGAFVEGSPLAWIARNSSKPGRPPGEAWVLHADPHWSREHFDDDLEAVARRLVEQLEPLAGSALPETELLQAFRWRYARSLSPGTPEGFLLDAAHGLALCGDWCVGLRVEGAWLSGLRAARALLGLA